MCEGHLFSLCVCAEKRGLRDTCIPMSAINSGRPQGEEWPGRGFREGGSDFVLYIFV